MKILRLIGGLDPEFGGPTESAVTACIAMQRAGHPTTFAFTSADRDGGPDAEVLAALQTANVTVKPFPYVRIGGGLGRRWGVSLSMLLWLARNCRRYDIVHLHGAWGVPSVIGLLLANTFGKPIIVSPHETLTRFDLDAARTDVRRWAKRGLRHLYLRWANVIVFSSQLELNDSVPSGTVAAATVVPHPVSSVREPHRRSGPATGESLVVGYLGRLHPKKNFEVLLAALAELPSTVTLRAAGSGESRYEQLLRELVDRLNLSNRVEWLGFVDAHDRDEFLGSIDVLALPSSYECFGMAVAEALAFGVPVVVSRTTGTAQIVDRFECGLVIESEAPALASALATLLMHNELREGMGSAAREAALAEFSVSAYERRLNAIYNRLLLSAGVTAT